MMTQRIAVAPLNREPAHDENGRFGYLIRRSVDEVERFFGWLYKWQRIEPTMHPVKVNLGSGLYVAPGWINIDGSVKTLFAKLPQFAVRRAYSLATVKDTHSRDEFVTLLGAHQFVYHNLKYGIPFRDSSVDFIFSSHVLHHLYSIVTRRWRFFGMQSGR